MYNFGTSTSVHCQAYITGLFSDLTNIPHRMMPAGMNKCRPFQTRCISAVKRQAQTIAVTWCCHEPALVINGGGKLIFVEDP